MRTISRLFGLTFVVAGLLAISVSAAQAMPTRASNDASDSAAVSAVSAAQAMPTGASNDASDSAAVNAAQTTVLHRSGFQIALTPDGPFALPNGNPSAGQAMQAAADSPTDQTAPLIISQPVPVAKAVSSDSGFGWSEFLVGAGVAALLLVLTGIAATRMRPQTVRL